MGFYVARSRQTPPENAFSQRRRARAEAAAAAKAPAPEPAKAAEQAPDLDALREAAARAAALVHAAEPGVLKDLSELEDTQATDEVDNLEALREAAAKAVAERTTVEPEPSRGRPASSDVAERTARILELITASGTAGISKPDLAAAVGTKEANVQVALGKLKGAGKVESRRLPDTGKYRWFLV